MTRAEIDGIIGDYLGRLDAALRDMPDTEREAFAAEFAEHIEEARVGLAVEDEVSIRALLEDMGEPDVIAATALDEQLNGPKKRGWRRLPRPSRRVLVSFAALMVIAGLAAAVALDPPGAGRVGPVRMPPVDASSVTVPDVVGQQVRTATRVLQDRGFHVKARQLPNLPVPANAVGAQDPGPGYQAPVGSLVSISFASSPASAGTASTTTTTTTAGSTSTTVTKGGVGTTQSSAPTETSSPEPSQDTGTTTTGPSSTTTSPPSATTTSPTSATTTSPTTTTTADPPATTTTIGPSTTPTSRAGPTGITTTTTTTTSGASPPTTSRP